MDIKSSDTLVTLQNLREKWNVIPSGPKTRVLSSDLLRMPPTSITLYWESVRHRYTSEVEERGWYHAYYSDYLSDKRVLDFGCGAGIDGVTYAERGASVTFVDIVQDNVDLVKRVCDFKGIEADYLYLERLKDINRLGEYDVILAMGSLHHAPYDFVKREVGLLLPHLISGGRWLQLAYPKERWIRDGSPPFSKWGEMTDGADTPWAEWYDVEKVLSLFDVDVRVIMTRKFNNNRFAWFDFEIL